jgi:hypothetical protein
MPNLSSGFQNAMYYCRCGHVEPDGGNRDESGSLGMDYSILANELTGPEYAGLSDQAAAA